MSVPVLISHIAAFVGIVILWFEDQAAMNMTNAVVGNLMPFINLYVAMWLLTFATLENPFVGSKHRTTLRSFAILMVFYYFPKCACILDAGRRYTDSTKIAIEAERDALKAGMFLVIIPAAFIYLRSFFVTNVGEKRPFAAIRGLYAFLFVLVIGALVVVQAVIYDDQYTCYSMGDAHLNPAHHFLLAVLVFAVAFLSDKEAGSLAFFLFNYYLLNYAPVFGENHPTGEKRQGQIIIGYIATWIYLLFSCVFARSNDQTKSESSKPRLFSQLILLGFAIAGAVCVYDRSPAPNNGIAPTQADRMRNYIITSAIFVPLLDLLAYAMNIHYFTVAATIVPLVFGGSIATELFHDSVLPLSPASSGVTRTGVVLSLIALYLSPVLSISLRNGEKSFRFLNESFEKKSWVYTSVAILLTYWGANRYAESDSMFFPLAYLGAVIYTSSEQGNHDGLRIALYFLANAAFQTWPLDKPLVGPNASPMAVFMFVIFWISITFSFFFAAESPDADGFNAFVTFAGPPPEKPELHYEEEREEKEEEEEEAAAEEDQEQAAEADAPAEDAPAADAPAEEATDAPQE